MPLLSPILDGFLNDHQSPEDLAENHNLSVREVLDVLFSEEATRTFRRLAQAERLRQAVLSARARSKALATLEYLTQFDRDAKHRDCDLRRRVSETILKQTDPTSQDRRAPSGPRTSSQPPDLIRLRATRVAAEQASDPLSDSLDRRGTAPSVSAPSISLPHPSPLFPTPLHRGDLRHTLALHPQHSKPPAKTSPCMSPASCTPPAQPRAPCQCRPPSFSP